MKKNREKVTWLDIVVEAIENIDKCGHLKDINQQVEVIANRMDKKLTTNWKATVRNVIECNSSDSKKFNGKDIFKSQLGVGRGVWRLN